jgi:cation diffusion facilitator family transporter
MGQVSMMLCTTLLLLHSANGFRSSISRQSQFLGVSSSKLLLPVIITPKNNNYPSTGNTLSMHMGHSHSHHQHDNNDASTSTTPKDPALQARQRLRRAAMFMFCLFATLGPRILRSKVVRGADWAAFFFTSLTLMSADKIRKEVGLVVNKLKNLRDGVAKHSTPVPVGQYLFANPNAADRVTLIGVIVNLVLSAGKFTVGVSCHSSALIADAGHSLSDLFSDFVTLYSVQLARLPPDDDHPYGHGKFEAIGSLFLSLILIGTGIGVGTMANKQLLHILATQRAAQVSGATAASMMNLPIPVPRPPALIMAALSIFSKEWLFRITKTVGDSLNSQVVIANAWHHRSDAYSSVLALISIGVAMAVPGMVAADSAAGLLVAGMICMTGADILGESIKQLSDTNNEDLVETIDKMVRSSTNVLSVQRIRARQVGSQAFVDVKIETAEGLSTSAARTVEERIRRDILQLSGVMDAEVHATPTDVVCPLLFVSPPSVSEIEDSVRQKALLHPGVDSVEGVTVHFGDTLRVMVDVNIRLEDSANTNSLVQAKEYAMSLKQRLEESNKIDEAHIFLDLNDSDSTPSKSASIIPVGNENR